MPLQLVTLLPPTSKLLEKHHQREPEGLGQCAPLPTHRTKNQPTELIVRLSRELGGEIPELGIDRRSLEDVYLSIVDRAEGSA